MADVELNSVIIFVAVVPSEEDPTSVELVTTDAALVTTLPRVSPIEDAVLATESIELASAGVSVWVIEATAGASEL